MTSPTISKSPQLPRGSLLGALRVGGVLLLFASLSVVASYLVFQKVWMEPAIHDSDATYKVMTAFADFRIAVVDERFARRSGDGSVVERAAVHSGTRSSELASQVAAARAAGVDGECIRADRWESIQRAVESWRAAASGSLHTSEEAAFAEVRRALEDMAGALRAKDADYTALFAELLEVRMWVLWVMGLTGGAGAWATTAAAIRGTRRSLRQIAGHIEALERGELSPRALDSYVEVAAVSERLNDLGRALAASRDEARFEREAAGSRQSELEFAHELVLELSRCRTEHDVAGTFLGRAAPALHAERLEILRLVEPPGFLEEVGARAPSAEGAALRIVEDPKSCLGLHALQSAPGARDPRVCPAAPDPTRATLCVPMMTPDGPFGVVHVVARSGAPLASIPRAYAEMLVRLLGTAIENARLLRESIERGATDPLTGLANRRRLVEHGSKAIALAKRKNLALAVAILDVDRFKEINDRHGHAAGDRALVVVARALREGLRETDLAARLGGDEFALLLPGSDARSAVAALARIRERVAALGRDLPFEISLSAGVGELAAGIAHLEDLLAEADRALYEAKRTGREPEPAAGAGA